MREILILLLSGLLGTSFVQAEGMPKDIEVSDAHKQLHLIECSIVLSREDNAVHLTFTNPTETTFAISISAFKNARFSAGFRSPRPGEWAGSGGMSKAIDFDAKSFSIIEGEVSKDGLVAIPPGKSAAFKLNISSIAAIVQQAGATSSGGGKGEREGSRRLNSISFTFKNLFAFYDGKINDSNIIFSTPTLVLPDDFK